MSEPLVTKVKMGRKKLEIQYAVEREESTDNPDVAAFKCGDAPADSFKDALAALRPHVAAMCEMPQAAEWSRNLIIEQVDILWRRENGVLAIGGFVKFRKPLKKSDESLVLVTPEKWEKTKQTKKDEEQYCLTEEQAAVLNEIASEALKYVKGQRAQLKLALAG